MMHARTSCKGWMAGRLCVAAVLVAGLAEAQAPDARTIPLGMADVLGTAPRLSVTGRASQASDLKIEGNEVRTPTLSRPDRLRATAAVLVLLGMITTDALTQRGDGGGRSGGGGASRESPTASGGLSSASGQNQAARQESRANALASP